MVQIDAPSLVLEFCITVDRVQPIQNRNFDSLLDEQHATMAEFFAKGPQSNFTKLSKQFAQEQVELKRVWLSFSQWLLQVMQQAIQDYAEELKQVLSVDTTDEERWHLCT